MDQTTLRFIAILVTVCILSAVNVTASVLGVPIITATIGDAISVLIASGAILLHLKTASADPPK